MIMDRKMKVLSYFLLGFGVKILLTGVSALVLAYSMPSLVDKALASLVWILNLVYMNPIHLTKTTIILFLVGYVIIGFSAIILSLLLRRSEVKQDK